MSVFIEVGTPAFARACAALARTLGPTHAPSFAAHVTLLYGIDPSAYGGAASVLATLRRACARAAPFELAVARGRFEGGWKFGDYAPFDMRFLQIEYEEAPVIDERPFHSIFGVGDRLIAVGGTIGVPFEPYEGLAYERGLAGDE